MMRSVQIIGDGGPLLREAWGYLGWLAGSVVALVSDLYAPFVIAPGWIDRVRKGWK
jgi:hypothetical protein